jgi:hypothetical protein
MGNWKKDKPAQYEIDPVKKYKYLFKAPDLHNFQLKPYVSKDYNFTYPIKQK